jgi:glutaminyl-peptide cyclotransferase
MRRHVAAALLSLALATPAAAQAPAPDVGQWQGERALADIAIQVSFGTRAMGTPGHQKTIAFIAAQLRALGSEPRLQRADVAADGTMHPITNIVASLYPSATKRIIVATHYDSIIRAYRDKEHPEAPMPGANNSASGVALLLEAARALKAQPAPPPLGVDLVFFDGEEGARSLGEGDPDFTPIGSAYFAQHLDEIYPRAKPIEAIDFDMVCWREMKLRPELGSLQVAGDEVRKFWTAGRLFAPAYFATEPTPAEIFDDQVALVRAHIPAFLVIGFDYEPWYNTTQDTPDKCSAAALAGVGRTLMRYLYAH